MRQQGLALALGLACLWSAGSVARGQPEVADAPPACLAPGDGTVRAAGALPATLVTADGATVRLADIVIADRPGARAASEAFLAAGTAAFRPVEGAEADRYGRLWGDVVSLATGGRLSVELVADGLAFVDPTVMSGRCLTALFAAEREAERARRGVWSSGGPVRSAADPEMAADAGAYVLAEGVVKSVGETKRTIYLNFGEDYRTDFTALVRRRDAKGWGDRLAALEGAKVRVRGVLESWNGGLIRVEHPAQLTVLDGAPLVR